MDILAQDQKKASIGKRWNNAAQDDLNSANADITALNKQYKAAQATYNSAQSNVDKCVAGKEGFGWYRCKNNTGKTLDDWEDIANPAKSEMNRLSTQIAKANGLRSSALKALANEAAAAGDQSTADKLNAEADVADSKASGAKAVSVGKWVGLGLGTVAIGALIWFKIIKKK